MAHAVHTITMLKWLEVVQISKTQTPGADEDVIDKRLFQSIGYSDDTE
jgi:hypothetical protein